MREPATGTDVPFPTIPDGFSCRAAPSRAEKPQGPVFLRKTCPGPAGPLSLKTGHRPVFRALRAPHRQSRWDTMKREGVPPRAPLIFLHSLRPIQNALWGACGIRRMNRRTLFESDSVRSRAPLVTVRSFCFPSVRCHIFASRNTCVSLDAAALF